MAEIQKNVIFSLGAFKISCFIKKFYKQTC